MLDVKYWCTVGNVIRFLKSKCSDCFEDAVDNQRTYTNNERLPP